MNGNVRSLGPLALGEGTETELDAAYSLGQAAADDGKSRMANPFIRSSDERAFCAWLDGYNDRIAPLKRQPPDWFRMISGLPVDT